jgi:hypothetical protein
MNKAAIIYIGGQIFEKDIKCFDLSALEQQYGISKEPTQRMIDLCKALRCSTYLSGQGGKNYIDERKFEISGVNIIYDEYIKNINNISILHYLFTEPLEKIREMIK